MQESLFEEPKPDYIEFNKSVFKSGIQKAVRRCEPVKAVRLAKSHIEVDPNDFLRRLLVIIIEDAMLHPGYAYVRECLGRPKSLTLQDKERLLGIVYDIAETEWRDFWMRNPEGIDVEPGEFEYLTDAEKDIVRAINYRSSIGGMGEDIKMLRVMTDVWTSRFASKEWTVERLKEHFTGNAISYDEVQFATDEDIILEAIDMHSFPPIVRMLKKKGLFDKLIRDTLPIYSKYMPDANEDRMIQQMLWNEIVATNYKKNIWFDPPRPIDWYKDDQFPSGDELREPFKECADSVIDEWHSIARWFIRKQLERNA